jgi:hypothetical protein
MPGNPPQFLAGPELTSAYHQGRGDVRVDSAELFIPLDKPLAPGPRDVDGTLHLIVRYATVSRSVRSSTSRVRLPLAEPGPVGS